MTTPSGAPLDDQIAQWRGVSAPQARDRRPGRRRARRPSPRPDGGPDHVGPGRRRSLPHRGQTHGQPRRAVARVRSRALGAAMEAAGHRRRTTQASRAHRAQHRDARRPRSRRRRGAWPSRCRRCSVIRSAPMTNCRRSTPATPACSSSRCSPSTSCGSVGRSVATRPLAGAALRGRGCVRQRLPLPHGAQRH